MLSAAALAAEARTDWPAGVWKGTLQAGGQQMEIVYRLEIDADGAWTGSMDVPAQGAVGLPLPSIDVIDDSISIGMPLPGNANYQGRRQAGEHRIEGRFSHAGQAFAMALEPVPSTRGPKATGSPWGLAWNASSTCATPSGSRIEISLSTATSTCRGGCPLSTRLEDSSPRVRDPGVQEPFRTKVVTGPSRVDRASSSSRNAIHDSAPA
jgi:hypothetical protein